MTKKEADKKFGIEYLHFQDFEKCVFHFSVSYPRHIVHGYIEYPGGDCRIDQSEPYSEMDRIEIKDARGFIVYRETRSDMEENGLFKDNPVKK